MKKLSLLCISLFWTLPVFSQIEISLANPSFEGYPRAGITPEGWYDCGSIHFPDESPPDIHPNPIPQQGFGVTTEVYDERTYLGLVVRDNDSWESVSQRLTKGLTSEAAYRFTVYLARSESYISAIGNRSSKDAIERDPNTIVNHNKPIVFRLWAGNGHCDKQQLIGLTAPIVEEYWEQYDFEFTPEERITHLTLEAFYKVPTLLPYNGNILVDNCSLFQIDSLSTNSTSLIDINSEILNTKGKIASIQVESNRKMVPSAKKRSWEELMVQADSNWLEIQGLIKNKKNEVELFPKAIKLEKTDFYAELVHKNEFLGAILKETGGMLVSKGWLRILGANRLEMGRSIASWNEGKTIDDSVDNPAFILIADDVVGGHFVINNGLFYQGIGEIYYLNPEYLNWIPLKITYSDFIHWAINGDVDEFYADFRWEGWEEDIKDLAPDESVLFKPLLWRKKRKLEKRERSVIPAQKMWDLQSEY